MIRIINNLLGYGPMNLGITRPADRFMLWVDAVGGYWVCLGDELTLGQPVRAGSVDVPILGDLSSRHAVIRRDGEGYVLEALRDVRIDDRPVRELGWLHDGSRIQLGESVRLLFRRPNALSGTARLDFVSRHRTQPSADAVLLMAETCILGPSPRCHVVCHRWTREVVLYRQKPAIAGRAPLHQAAIGGRAPLFGSEQLYCRAAGPLQIDGVSHERGGPITRNSRIEGDGFSFNLEAIEE
jgi:hypothetical protein